MLPPDGGSVWLNGNAIVALVLQSAGALSKLLPESVASSCAGSAGRPHVAQSTYYSGDRFHLDRQNDRPSSTRNV